MRKDVGDGVHIASMTVKFNYADYCTSYVLASAVVSMHVSIIRIHYRDVLALCHVLYSPTHMVFYLAHAHSQNHIPGMSN